jgi:cysteine desulfurase/selenocysteine lyase
MDSLAQYRSLFPVTKAKVYLNHASTGPLPNPAAEAMGQLIRMRQDCDPKASEWRDRRVEEVRGLVARLLHATADEIAFVSSTSHGLNVVAAGLPWHAGDSMVCAETEFPANVYPWLNLRRRGVDVRFAGACCGRITLDAIRDQIDDSTRLVAISFVEFCTGFRNDLRAIADLCHDHGVLLCVDGIQGLGALDLDVQETGIDFLSAQAAKWLLGPIGTGFLYCRREHQKKLDLAMAGWKGALHQDDYFRYDYPWAENACRFETGSLNHVGLAGMGASLELLLEVGIPRIESRIMQLTDHLLELLEGEGYEILTPHACRDERSGIVSFAPGDKNPVSLAEWLAEQQILVSARGDHVRVSPHFYNTEHEIEQLVSAVGAAPRDD